MLGPFLAAHPEIEIELVLSDVQTDLLAERIDVAIRLAPDAPPDTVVSKLCPTRYRVVAAADFTPRPERPADLSDIDVVRFAYPGFRDLWRFRKDSMVKEVPVKGRVEITGAAAVLPAVHQSLGPGLIADWLLGDDLRTGALVDLFPDHEVTATGFDTAAWIMTPPGRYQPLKVRAFVAALRRAVENRLIPGEISKNRI